MPVRLRWLRRSTSQATSLSEMHEHGGVQNTSDSAGIPWQGRTFAEHPDPFANDLGTIPPALAAVLDGFKAGVKTKQEVLSIFAESRVLVPLLAIAGETGVTPDGKIVDKTQELSIVTVQAPDGRSVLPVFSSVDAMNRWNPEARPVPNLGRNVAVAALDDANELVVLDPTSPGTEFGIRRPALWALVRGEPAFDCASDSDVLAAFNESIQSESMVSRLALRDGDPQATLQKPELTVVLELRPGLDDAALSALLTRLQQRWSVSQVIAERVDSMAVKLATAEAA